MALTKEFQINLKGRLFIPDGFVDFLGKKQVEEDLSKLVGGEGGVLLLEEGPTGNSVVGGGVLGAAEQRPLGAHAHVGAQKLEPLDCDLGENQVGNALVVLEARKSTNRDKAGPLLASLRKKQKKSTNGQLKKKNVHTRFDSSRSAHALMATLSSAGAEKISKTSDSYDCDRKYVKNQRER